MWGYSVNEIIIYFLNFNFVLFYFIYYERIKKDQ